jgi:hypothetical protein
MATSTLFATCIQPPSGGSRWVARGRVIRRWPATLMVASRCSLRGEDAQMYQAWQTAPNNGWALV